MDSYFKASKTINLSSNGDTKKRNSKNIEYNENVTLLSVDKNITGNSDRINCPYDISTPTIYLQNQLNNEDCIRKQDVSFIDLRYTEDKMKSTHFATPMKQSDIALSKNESTCKSSSYSSSVNEDHKINIGYIKNEEIIINKQDFESAKKYKLDHQEVIKIKTFNSLGGNETNREVGFHTERDKEMSKLSDCGTELTSKFISKGIVPNAQNPKVIKKTSLNSQTIANIVSNSVIFCESSILPTYDKFKRNIDNKCNEPGSQGNIKNTSDITSDSFTRPNSETENEDRKNTCTRSYKASNKAIISSTISHLYGQNSVNLNNAVETENSSIFKVRKNSNDAPKDMSSFSEKLSADTYSADIFGYEAKSNLYNNNKKFPVRNVNMGYSTFFDAGIAKAHSKTNFNQVQECKLSPQKCTYNSPFICKQKFQNNVHPNISGNNNGKIKLKTAQENETNMSCVFGKEPSNEITNLSNSNLSQLRMKPPDFTKLHLTSYSNEALIEEVAGNEHSCKYEFKIKNQTANYKLNHKMKEYENLYVKTPNFNTQKLHGELNVIESSQENVYNKRSDTGHISPCSPYSISHQMFPSEQESNESFCGYKSPKMSQDLVMSPCIQPTYSNNFKNDDDKRNRTSACSSRYLTPNLLLAQSQHSLSFQNHHINDRNSVKLRPEKAFTGVLSYTKNNESLPRSSIPLSCCSENSSVNNIVKYSDDYTNPICSTSENKLFSSFTHNKNSSGENNISEFSPRRQYDENIEYDKKYKHQSTSEMSVLVKHEMQNASSESHFSKLTFYSKNSVSSQIKQSDSTTFSQTASNAPRNFQYRNPVSDFTSSIQTQHFPSNVRLPNNENFHNEQNYIIDPQLHYYYTENEKTAKSGISYNPAVKLEFNQNKKSYTTLPTRSSRYEYDQKMRLTQCREKSFVPRHLDNFPKGDRNSIRPIVNLVRKPNYQEMINNAFAIRQATSERDLNYQIIKRTLNKDSHDQIIQNDEDRNNSKLTSHVGNKRNEKEKKTLLKFENVNRSKLKMFEMQQMESKHNRNKSIISSHTLDLKNDSKQLVSNIITPDNDFKTPIVSEFKSPFEIYKDVELPYFSSHTPYKALTSKDNIKQMVNFNKKELLPSGIRYANQHTNFCITEIKKESPLDLSVKTVKTKADSTGCDTNISHQQLDQGLKFNFTPNFSEYSKDGSEFSESMKLSQNFDEKVKYMNISQQISSADFFGTNNFLETSNSTLINSNTPNVYSVPPQTKNIYLGNSSQSIRDQEIIELKKRPLVMTAEEHFFPKKFDCKSIGLRSDNERSSSASFQMHITSPTKRVLQSDVLKTKYYSNKGNSSNQKCLELQEPSPMSICYDQLEERNNKINTDNMQKPHFNSTQFEYKNNYLPTNKKRSFDSMNLLINDDIYEPPIKKTLYPFQSQRESSGECKFKQDKFQESRNVVKNSDNNTIYQLKTSEPEIYLSEKPRIEKYIPELKEQNYRNICYASSRKSVHPGIPQQKLLNIQEKSSENLKNKSCFESSTALNFVMAETHCNRKIADFSNKDVIKISSNNTTMSTDLFTNISKDIRHVAKSPVLRGADQNTILKLRNSLEMREFEKQKTLGSQSNIEEPIVQEPHNKTDITFILAARIRTKGELKSLPPTEIKLPIIDNEINAINAEKSLQSVEDKLLLTQTSTFNLADWENACDDFVDQLQIGINKKVRKKRKGVKISIETDIDIKDDSISTSLPGVEYKDELDKKLIRELQCGTIVTQKDNTIGSSDEDKPLLFLQKQNQIFSKAVTSTPKTEASNELNGLKFDVKSDQNSNDKLKPHPKNDEKIQACNKGKINDCFSSDILDKQSKKGYLTNNLQQTTIYSKKDTDRFSVNDNISGTDSDAKESKSDMLTNNFKTKRLSLKMNSLWRVSKRNRLRFKMQSDSDRAVKNLKLKNSKILPRSRRMRPSTFSISSDEDNNIVKSTTTELTKIKQKRKLYQDISNVKTKKVNSSKKLKSNEIGNQNTFLDNQKVEKAMISKFKNAINASSENNVCRRNNNVVAKPASSILKTGHDDKETNLKQMGSLTLRCKNSNVNCRVKNGDKRKSVNIKTTVSKSMGNSSESDFETVSNRLRSRKITVKNDVLTNARTKSTMQSSKSKIGLSKQNILEKKISQKTQSNIKCKTITGWESEVYQYKRSLKIPPNLINIKRPTHDRVSTSLPDLDVHSSDEHLDSTVQNSNICKKGINQKISERVGKSNNFPNKVLSEALERKESKPKSIIDVLHQRIFAPTRITRRDAKRICGEDFKTLQKCSNETEFLKLPDRFNYNSKKTKLKNVFETEVLLSRTRTEYRLMKNKEFIREIFGGEDRPASAPPEFRDLEKEIKAGISITFDEKYAQYMQKMNVDFGEKIRKNRNKINKSEELDHKEDDDTQLACTSLTDSNSDVVCCEQNSIDINMQHHCQTNVENKLVNVKCEKPLVKALFSRKNCKNRNFRRKASSGFDYIRKKKKVSFFNGQEIKKNSTVLSKFSFCRDENDVSKDIQRWVLNKSVGQSVLHKAARLGYLDVIAYCLERIGMNPDPKDNAGYTPLHEACAKGRLDIARILLQYGANHSETALSGIRPLHEATENGFIEIARLLLSYGADPLLTTYSGQTPLMLAENKEMQYFIKSYLFDVQNTGPIKQPWKFEGPWKIYDQEKCGYNVFDASPESEIVNHEETFKRKKKHLKTKTTFFEKFNFISEKKCTDLSLSMRAKLKAKCSVVLNNIDPKDHQNSAKQLNGMPKKTVKSVIDLNGRKVNELNCDKGNVIDIEPTYDEIFEFEEAEAPLPPLYLLRDEGTEKWVLLNDLCNLLKVKSKDTLLKQICPTIPPSMVNKELLRELKMSDFLERATCLQLLSAGEKLNIRSSKVVLIKYNDDVRKLLGVKTFLMKF